MAEDLNYIEKNTIQRQRSETITRTYTVDTTTNAIAASDTVKLFDLGIGKITVMSFDTDVNTADGETATADFGLRPSETATASFTADPNGLNDAVDLNSTGYLSGAAGTDAQIKDPIDATYGAELYMTPDHALENVIFNVIIQYTVE